MSKHLALDVGLARIGVAVSDAGGRIASPLGVIRRSSKAEDYARIAELCRAQGAEVLLVGLPLDADDRMGPAACRIERYAEGLVQALRAQGLELELRLWDEHGSTLRAQDSLLATGRGARERRARIDAAAAAVILQDYLDAHRSAQ